VAKARSRIASIVLGTMSEGAVERTRRIGQDCRSGGSPCSTSPDDRHRRKIKESAISKDRSDRCESSRRRSRRDRRVTMASTTYRVGVEELSHPCRSLNALALMSTRDPPQKSARQYAEPGSPHSKPQSQSATTVTSKGRSVPHFGYHRFSFAFTRTTSTSIATTRN